MLLIGHKLRKIRMLKDIDAKKLCSDIKISSTQLSRIENDEIKIDVELVQKFADYFKMPLEEVLHFGDATKIINNHNSTLSNGGDNYGTINEPSVVQGMLKLVLEKMESMENRIKNLERR